LFLLDLFSANGYNRGGQEGYGSEYNVSINNSGNTFSINFSPIESIDAGIKENIEKAEKQKTLVEILK
jgi:hypothetical protein